MSEGQPKLDLLRVMSPEEVATLLRKSRSWVYGHAAELGASKIGSTWIFTQEGLSEALRNSRKENTAKTHSKHTQEKLLIMKRSSRELETVNEGLKRHGLK